MLLIDNFVKQKFIHSATGPFDRLFFVYAALRFFYLTIELLCRKTLYCLKRKPYIGLFLVDVMGNFFK